TPKLLSSALVNDVWGTLASVTDTTPGTLRTRVKIPQRAPRHPEERSDEGPLSAEESARSLLGSIGVLRRLRLLRMARDDQSAAPSTFSKDGDALSSSASSRSSVAGSRSAKTLPPPCLAAYVTSPPWISASVRAMESPSPARPASGVALRAR